MNNQDNQLCPTKEIFNFPTLPVASSTTTDWSNLTGSMGTFQHSRLGWRRTSWRGTLSYLTLRRPGGRGTIQTCYSFSTRTWRETWGLSLIRSVSSWTVPSLRRRGSNWLTTWTLRTSGTIQLSTRRLEKPSDLWTTAGTSSVREKLEAGRKSSNIFQRWRNSLMPGWVNSLNIVMWSSQTSVENHNISNGSMKLLLYH